MLRRALLIAATVVVLDHLTKAWIVLSFPLGFERDVIPGLFRLVHARNRGVAFSLFADGSAWTQGALLAVIVAVIALIVWQLARGGMQRLAFWGLTLVLGGAVGNLIDRVVRGEVVDFLAVFIVSGGREHHWPAFNVADSAISVGAGLVILAEILTWARSRHVPVPR